MIESSYIAQPSARSAELWLQIVLTIISALIVILSCSISQATSNFPVEGRWVGTINQQGKLYPVKLILSKAQSRVDYPTLGCSGMLKLISSTADRYDFVEEIRIGKSKCIDNGLVSLSIVQQNILFFEWQETQRSPILVEGNLERKTSSKAVELAENKLLKIPRSDISIPTSTRGWYQHIVPGGRISGYVHGQYPAEGDKTHPGVDIGKECGEKVLAPVDGVLFDYINTETDNQWSNLGFMVILQHNSITEKGTAYTMYLHFDKPPVVANRGRGAIVKAGEQLGIMGETGFAKGCHVHFEVRRFAGIEHGYFPEWKSIYGVGDVSESAQFLENWLDPQTWVTTESNITVEANATAQATAIQDAIKAAEADEIVRAAARAIELEARKKAAQENAAAEKVKIAEAARVAEQARLKAVAERAEAERLAEQARLKAVDERAEAERLAEQARLKAVDERAEAERVAEQARALKRKNFTNFIDQQQAKIRGPSYEVTIDFISKKIPPYVQYDDSSKEKVSTSLSFDGCEMAIEQHHSYRSSLNRRRIIDNSFFYQSINLEVFDPTATSVAWSNDGVQIKTKEGKKLVQRKMGKSKPTEQINYVWLRGVIPPRQENQAKLVKAFNHLIELCGGTPETF